MHHFWTASGLVYPALHKGITAVLSTPYIVALYNLINTLYNYYIISFFKLHNNQGRITCLIPHCNCVGNCLSGMCTKTLRFLCILLICNFKPFDSSSSHMKLHLLNFCPFRVQMSSLQHAYLSHHQTSTPTLCPSPQNH